MEKREYYKRAFLNTEGHGGTAFIEASIERYANHSGKDSIEGSIKIADCNRVVDLNFWPGSEGEESYYNAFRKIATLRRTLAAFEAALKEAVK